MKTATHGYSGASDIHDIRRDAPKREIIRQ